jgi:SAM-dependent methyltransferase
MRKACSCDDLVIERPCTCETSAVPDEPVSRRGLFSLGWARAPLPRAARAGLEAHRAARLDAWEAGAADLHAALAALVGVLCDVAGAGSERQLLEIDAGKGALAAEAARRGAVVTACDPALLLVEAGREVTEDEGLDVLWELAAGEALPFADGAFDAVVSLYGTMFAPRPRRTLRELLRVLVPGGLLVLAAPAPRSFYAAALALADPPPEGVPDPAGWGDPELALERIAAVAPGTEAETRELPFELEWPSEERAWAACAPGLALPARARDPFAGLVASRSAELSRVRIPERATLIVARREP